MTAVLVHGVPETAAVWDRLSDHSVGDTVTSDEVREMIYGGTASKWFS